MSVLPAPELCEEEFATALVCVICVIRCLVWLIGCLVVMVELFCCIFVEELFGIEYWNNVCGEMPVSVPCNDNVTTFC